MKYTLKERIKADLKKQFDKYQGSASWLNSALPFNHSLRLKEDQKENLDFFLRLLSVSKRKENYLNLDILIANLLCRRYRITNKAKRPIRVPLNTLNWKITRYTRAGESTIKLIKKLHKQGYIELKIGYRTKKESRTARIWPTDKLLAHFPKIDNVVNYNPIELVILRDDNKKLIDYKDTTKTRKIREILTRVNEVNQSAKIQYKEYTLHPFLVAIFRRKFTLYGRLHTRGYRHYQSYSSDERKEITINNEPGVE